MSLTWIHTASIAVRTTVPCAVWAGAGAAACGAGAGAVAAGAGALVLAASDCSSERRLSQLITTISRITAATPPITSHLGMVRAGSAGSNTSACELAKRCPPISSRS